MKIRFILKLKIFRFQVHRLSNCDLQCKAFGDSGLTTLQQCHVSRLRSQKSNLVFFYNFKNSSLSDSAHFKLNLNQDLYSKVSKKTQDRLRQGFHL
jgi:hypothetical protein